MKPCATQVLTRTRGVIAAIVALAGSSSAFGQAEVEPNNTVSQANVLASTNTTVTGSFINNSDFDYFKITLTETTSLSINLWGPTSGVCAGNNYDPTLHLFDSAGVQIAANDDFGSLCSRLDVTTAPVMGTLPPGVYYIRAAQLTNNLQQGYSLVIASVPAAEPLAESFTYQGKLNAAGSPVNGETAMRFSLWSHPSSTLPSSRLSMPIQYPGVAVIGGLFAVDLDFTIPNGPEIFDGTERYLEIEVADLNGSGNFTKLTPRQRVSPAPHAVFAIKSGDAARAELASNATNANSAVNAQYAEYAQDANTASTANTAATAATAGAVPWSGITGKPSEFADNDDATGGWTESGTITYTNLDVGINTSNAAGFSLAVSGTAAKTGGGTWATFCDERLKHDIKPMTGTLDRLLQLRGYTYEYNTDAVETRLALPGVQMGLMAQEVERVFPDWVGKDNKGYRYVTERSTTALMVEALRDLRAEKDAQIESLKKEAAAREAQNAELKARLDAIEVMLKAGRTDEKTAR